MIPTSILESFASLAAVPAVPEMERTADDDVTVSIVSVFSVVPLTDLIDGAGDVIRATEVFDEVVVESTSNMSWTLAEAPIFFEASGASKRRVRIPELVVTV